MITIPKIPPQLIEESHIDGLTGRVLELPYKGEGNPLPILLLYGHHSSLERMYSTAQALQPYGPVTTPDLPGFGAMPSLATVNKAPTIDNLADYLAKFITTRFPEGQKFVLEAMSLGFVIAVRMLQRHPQLIPQIAHLVSVVGFAHHDDFHMTQRKRRLLTRTARLLAKQAAAKTFDSLVLRKPIIAATYNLRARNHPKMKGFTWEERQHLISFEMTLWKTNEVRTYFTTMAEMLTLDLTKDKLPIPVEHVGVSTDQYFNNDQVIGHLGQIFTAVHTHEAILPNHVPTVIEDVESAQALVPESLVHIFTRNA